MNNIRFSKNKAKWKKKVSETLIDVDDLAKLFNAGHHIGMKGLYGVGWDVQKRGCEGEKLVELSRALHLQLRKDVLESFGATCALLEVASKTLEYMLESQNTPNIEFPMYASPLRATSVIETGDRLKAFGALRKKVESGVDDHEG